MNTWIVRCCLTQFVLGARLELLVRHQLFHLPRHRLDVVDDQLIKIGVLVLRVNNELVPNTLPSEVGVRLNDIYTTVRSCKLGVR